MEQVVMLPTNEKSLNSVFTLRSDKPYLMSEQNSPFKARIYDTKDLYHTYFNLYIISDDEIKEDDWYYDNVVLQIRQWKSFMIYNKLQHKKVIATTDTSLYIHQEETFYLPERVFYLPQPSQQFIEKYIEEYNKGNIITDVLVEYEIQRQCVKCKTIRSHYLCKCGEQDNYENTLQLKINPKDNTITIKKVKDSYTREEVIEFGNKVKEYCKDGWKPDSLHRVFFEWDKWIEENL